MVECHSPFGRFGRVSGRDTGADQQSRGPNSPGVETVAESSDVQDKPVDADSRCGIIGASPDQLAEQRLPGYEGVVTRRVCVVTGTRAEYGLLRWIMWEIREDPEMSLQILVTGMHLSPEFGLTFQDIEKDGFEISAKVEMLLSSDSPVGIAKSIGLGIIGMADTFQQLRPDIVLILGDRFEILAAAQAAMVARIPVAHLYGGEATEGVIDESIRHAVTKMSHFHFVTAEEYRRRVIQLGENPKYVFNFGAPGLDNLNRLRLLSVNELEKELEFELGDPTFLVTYHPVTLDHRCPENRCAELLSALDEFPEARIIFTKSNADTEGRIINQMIHSYVAERSGRTAAFMSLGQRLYLSALKHSDIVIGNSSSGLLEAPSLSTPTVNIGPRQRGRIRAASVVDCEEEREEIVEAIHTVLRKDFKSYFRDFTSPYGKAGASVRIKEKLKNLSLEDVLMKTFYDPELG